MSAVTSAMNAHRDTAVKLNFDAIARKLVSLSLNEGFQCAMELRERMDIVHSSEYGQFLHFLFPSFRKLLISRLESDRCPGSIENRFRHIILEILNRLPNNEVLRPYTRDLLRLATETLACDNEENGLTCLRIIFDLHKNFRPSLEGEVQAFLDLVQRIYGSLPESVEKAFRDNETNQSHACYGPVVNVDQKSADAAGPQAESRLRTLLGSNPATSRGKCGDTISAFSRAEAAVAPNDVSSHAACPVVFRGMQSFKVLTECPLLVMLLFQLYPKYIQENIPRLTPLMMSGLGLKTPVIARHHERYSEFIACQVKTLSFLTYLLRGFSELMKPHEDAISQSVLTLMTSCPSEAVSTRKELLVATRHILATEFRDAFFKHVDVLLDEDTVVGAGRQCRESLRPLAYSTLADLIHHMRPRLNADQLGRVVTLFARNLHDSALPLSVQSTSIRLLLNLVNFIVKDNKVGASNGKFLLTCILRAFVANLSGLQRMMDSGRGHNLHHHKSISLASDSKMPVSSIGSLSGSRRSLVMSEHMVSTTGMLFSAAEVREDYDNILGLFQTLLRGFKTVVWCIYHCSKSSISHQNISALQVPEDSAAKATPKAHFLTSQHDNDQSVSEGRIGTSISSSDFSAGVLSVDEVRIIASFFEHGIVCCRHCEKQGLAETELKEIFDNFAGVFTVLDGSTLRRVLGQCFSMFFESMLETPRLVTVAQLLLANLNSSATFADMLLDYLLSKLDTLANIQPILRDDLDLLSRVIDGLPTSARQALLVLKLYKFTFGSAPLFGGNEAAFLGRLRQIVHLCIHNTVAVGEPLGFLLLLRALSRAFSRILHGSEMGSLKQCYDELAAIWPATLDVILHLRRFSDDSSLNYDLLTEIALTMPSPPSAFDTFAYKLLPLLLHALNGCSGLTSIALRCVERHIDNVGARHFVGQLSRKDNAGICLVVAICRHLKPSPYPYGIVALRILGKFGGQLIGKMLSCVLIGSSSLRPIEVDAPVQGDAFSLLVPSPNFQGGTPSYAKHPFLKLELHLVSMVNCSDVMAAREMSAIGASTFNFDIERSIFAVCQLFQNLLSFPSQVSPIDVKQANAVSLGSVVRRRYKHVCFRFILAAFAYCCRFPGHVGATALQEISNGDITPYKPLYDDLKGIVDSQTNIRAIFDVLMTSILSARTESELAREASEILDVTCNLAAASASSLSTLVISHTTLSRDQAHPKAHGIMMLSHFLICALVDASSSLSVHTQEVAAMYLNSLISRTPSAENASSIDSAAVTLFDQIVSQLCLRLQDLKIKAKQGLCVALRKLTTYRALWCDLHLSSVLKSILTALSFLNTPGSLREVNLLTATMCAILRSMSPLLSKLSLQSISDGLLSKHAAVRLCCQSALTEVCVSSSGSLISFSHLSLEVKRSFIEQCLQQPCPLDTLIGCLDFLSFCLATDQPEIVFDDKLQRGLCKLIKSSNWLDVGSRLLKQENKVALDSSRYPLCRHSGTGFFGELNTQILAPLSSEHVRWITCIAIMRVCIAGVRQASKQAHRPTHSNEISIECFQVMLNFAIKSPGAYHPFAVSTVCTLLQLVAISCPDAVVKTVDSHMDSLFQSIQCEKHADHIEVLGRLERLFVFPCVHVRAGHRIRIALFSSIETLDETLDNGFNVLSFSALSILLRLLSVIQLDLAYAATLPDYHDIHSNVKSVAGSPSLNAVDVVKRMVGMVRKMEMYLPDVISNVRSKKQNYDAHHLQSESTFPMWQDSLSVTSCYAPVESRSDLSDGFFPFLEQVNLCRFLSRHAKAASVYFTEPQNMADTRLFAFFQYLLKKPQASGLRSYLLSADGADLLVERIFRIPSGTPAACGDGFVSNKEAYVDRLSERIIAGNKDFLLGDFVSYHGIELLWRLACTDASFLKRNPPLVGCLRSIWRQFILHDSGTSMLPERDRKICTVAAEWFHESGLQERKKRKMVAECLVTYSLSNPSNLLVVFELLHSLISPTLLDVTFLKKFFLDTATSWSNNQKLAAFMIFLRLLSDVNISEEVKLVALRHLVLPCTVQHASHFSRSTFHPEKSTMSLPKSVISLYVQTVFSVSGKNESEYPAVLRTELLKLATVFIELVQRGLAEHRKDLIKFAWNHLKSEDSMCRQWAHVNVCRFIATYETPPKIILQVYVALLRTFQPETRDLVRLALDVLLPALPFRLSAQDFLKAIKWTKKITYEEGHTLPQLIHIWQLIIRHPRLFYEYRGQFTPQMVNSLNRLGLAPNCPIENRELAVNVIDLIIAWDYEESLNSRRSVKQDVINHDSVDAKRCCSEIRNQAAHKSITCGSHEDEKSHIASSFSPFEPGLTLSTADLLANFLVRLALFSSDNKEPCVQRLAELCARLIRAVLNKWPSVNVRFAYFEKLIATSLSQRNNRTAWQNATSTLPERPTVLDFQGVYSSSLLSTCLDITIATLDAGSKPNPFFLDNLYKVQHLIFPCFKSRTESIHKKLHQLLSLVLTHFSPSQFSLSSPVRSFYSNLHVWLEQTFSYASQNHGNLLVENDDPATPARGGFTIEDDEDGSKCLERAFECSTSDGILMSGLHSLSLMCENTHQFMMNHVCSLIRLAFLLFDRHLRSNGNGRVSFTGQHSRSRVAPRVAATPTMSILSHTLGTPQQMQMRCASFCHSAASLKICIKILAQASQLDCWSSVRRPVVALVFGCIEKSESISLLQTVYKVATGWVCSSQSLLSRMEKIALIQSMSEMDKFPEVESQSIVSLYLMVSRCLCTKLASPTQNLQRSTIFGIPVNPVVVYGRGMLCVHPGVRNEFIARFIAKGRHLPDSSPLSFALNVNWSPISSRFWLVIILEILLDEISQSNPAAVYTFPLTSNNKYYSRTVPTLVQSEDGVVDDLHASRLSWYYRSTSCFLTPLREIAHVHYSLAEHLIQTFLPVALQGNGGMKAVCKQLACEYHTENIHVPSVMVRRFEPWTSVLEVPRMDFLSNALDIELQASTRPRPSDRCNFGHISPRNIPSLLVSTARHAGYTELAPHILKSLACRYGCIHEVLCIIELSLSEVAGVFSSKWKPHWSFELLSVAICLLNDLAELDIIEALLESVVGQENAKFGLQESLYGRTSKARMHFLSAMKEFASDFGRCTDVVDGSREEVMEQAIIENQWVRCSHDLSHWAALRQMGECDWRGQRGLCIYRNYHQLGLEASWKMEDWEGSRRIVNANQCSALCDESVQFKLHEVRLAVLDARYTSADILCSHCADMSLREWCSLPRTTVLSIAQCSAYFHLFHELVEIHESTHMLHATDNLHNREVDRVKPAFLTWQHRLPEAGSSITEWEDIMLWRERCRDIRDGDHECFDGTSDVHRQHQWISMAKLWQAGRKRGCLEYRMHPATPLFHPEILTEESRERRLCFSLLREYVLNHLAERRGVTHMKVNWSLMNHLQQLVSSLVSSNAWQVAELFCLQGVLLASTLRFNKAHAAFSMAVDAEYSHGRAWFAWATLCDTQFDSICEDQMDRFKGPKSISSPNLLGEYAILSYLNAVQFETQRAAPPAIARVLWLLHSSGYNESMVRAFSAKSSLLPVWTWIPWICSLLSIVSKTSLAAHSCLIRIGSKHPQSLIYALNASLEEKCCLRANILKVRDESTSGSSMCQAQEAEDLSCWIRHALNLQSSIHAMNNYLSHSIRHLCTEVASRFAATHEERYARTVSNFMQHHNNSPVLCHPHHTREFITRLKELLHFPETTAHGEQASITNELLDHYERGVLLLSKLVQGQRKHQGYSATFLSRSTVVTRSNFVHFRDSQMFNGEDHRTPQPVEVPGQYTCLFLEPRPDLHAMASFIDPRVVLQLSGCSLLRWGNIGSSDGEDNYFQFSEQAHLLSSRYERMQRLLAVIDRSLARSAIAQRRKLRVKCQKFTPLSKSICFVDSDFLRISLGEMFLMYDLSHKCFLSPCLSVRRTVSHAVMSGMVHEALDASSMVRYAQNLAYVKNCETVSPRILSKFTETVQDSVGSLWGLRTRFAVQHASYSLVSYSTVMGQNSPNELCLNASSGCVCYENFQLSPAQEVFTPSGEIPFRLTRNIKEFVGPLILQSRFVHTIGLIAHTMNEDVTGYGGTLTPCLSLLLCEDAWTQSLYRPLTNPKDRSCVISSAQLLNVNNRQAAFTNRIRFLIPELRPGHASSTPHSGIRKLLEAASDDVVIARMYPSWQPWL